MGVDDSRKVQILLAILLLFCSSGILYTRNHFPTADIQVGRFLAPSPDTIYLTFGYREIVADLLWIRVVQDFSYCENRDGEKKKNDYEYTRVLKRNEFLVCEKSWVYQMLDRITDLDPQFRIAYQAGGTMLSLLVNDKLGAQAIFSKGIRQYPHDSNLYYRAAYHQLYEMQNNLKAAQYLERSADNGGPRWFRQLAARLYTKEGKAEIGRAILDDFAKNNSDMAGSKRFKELSAQIDRELREARAPAGAAGTRAKK